MNAMSLELDSRGGLHRADAFQKMCQERRDLEKVPFAAARSHMEPAEPAIRGDGEGNEVPLVGRFE